MYVHCFHQASTFVFFGWILAITETKNYPSYLSYCGVDSESVLYACICGWVGVRVCGWCVCVWLGLELRPCWCVCDTRGIGHIFGNFVFIIQLISVLISH